MKSSLKNKNTSHMSKFFTSLEIYGKLKLTVNGKGKVVPGAFLNNMPCRHMGIGGIAPQILNLGTSWR
jgi:hypothetical protein